MSGKSYNDELTEFFQYLESMEKRPASSLDRETQMMLLIQFAERMGLKKGVEKLAPIIKQRTAPSCRV